MRNGGMEGWRDGERTEVCFLWLPGRGSKQSQIDGKVVGGFPIHAFSDGQDLWVKCTKDQKEEVSMEELLRKIIPIC
jgi:hypothetical protein